MTGDMVQMSAKADVELNTTYTSRVSKLCLDVELQQNIVTRTWRKSALCPSAGVPELVQLYALAL